MTHDEAAAAPTTPKMGPTGDDYTRTVWRDRGAQIARLLAENAALTRECLDREATEADVRSRLAGAEARLAQAWDDGYAVADDDFTHSDYCGNRCQCKGIHGRTNPYRAAP